MTAVVRDTVMVRAVRDDDARAIAEIVFEHGLPREWSWPSKAYAGTVAEVDGVVVAFCALTRSIYGLVIEEFWCRKSRAGVLGLGTLGRWIESIAQREADERGEAIEIGGCVRLDNPSHMAVLEKRGYEMTARVLAKRFEPSASRETSV